MDIKISKYIEKENKYRYLKSKKLTQDRQTQKDIKKNINQIIIL